MGGNRGKCKKFYIYQIGFSVKTWVYKVGI